MMIISTIVSVDKLPMTICKLFLCLDHLLFLQFPRRTYSCLKLETSVQYPFHGSYFLVGIQEGSPRTILWLTFPKFQWNTLGSFLYANYELQLATDNFSGNNVLPYGFHKVYKGKLADGSLVAVKRFLGAELHEFQIEVETMKMASHRNIIHLLGYCITSKKQLLVYPFMVNGSVASCLQGRPALQPPLDWRVRKRIALGPAKGLAYLHEECDMKIIHRDVKAANILLDEDFEALIADFELAELMDRNDTHVATAVRGTNGYIAPEYISTAVCTEKTDVFGYGVFLLELVTGYTATQLSSDNSVSLFDWVKGLLLETRLETIVDADFEGNYIDEEVEQLLQLAVLCTQTTPDTRPKMSEMVRMLQDGDGLAERWELWKAEEFLLPQELNHNSGTIKEEFLLPQELNHNSWIIEEDVPQSDELSGPRNNLIRRHLPNSIFSSVGVTKPRKSIRALVPRPLGME